MSDHYKIILPILTSYNSFTSEIHQRLLTGQSPSDSDPPTDGTVQAATPLRHMLSTLMLFFSSTYKSVFGFEEGPPIHDALTIAYLCRPELFETTRYRVDVELAGTHTVGETVVDIWNYRNLDEDDWGANGKNCIVAEGVDVSTSIYLCIFAF